MVFCNGGVRFALGVLFAMGAWIVSIVHMAVVTMHTVVPIVVSILTVTMTTFVAAMFGGVYVRVSNRDILSSIDVRFHGLLLE